MSKKTTSSLANFLWMAIKLFNVTNNFSKLVSSKISLLGDNIVTIIVLSVMGAILLAFSWLALLCVLFFYLMSIQPNWIVAFLIPFAFNLLLIFVIKLVLNNIKGKFSISEA